MYRQWYIVYSQLFTFHFSWSIVYGQFFMAVCSTFDLMMSKRSDGNYSLQTWAIGIGIFDRLQQVTATDYLTIWQSSRTLVSDKPASDTLIWVSLKNVGNQLKTTWHLTWIIIIPSKANGCVTFYWRERVCPYPNHVILALPASSRLFILVYYLTPSNLFLMIIQISSP